MTKKHGKKGRGERRYLCTSSDASWGLRGAGEGACANNIGVYAEWEKIEMNERLIALEVEEIKESVVIV